VMSTSSMNVATHTARRVHHLRSMPFSYQESSAEDEQVKRPPACQAARR
jgi:hypothetical protein